MCQQILQHADEQHSCEISKTKSASLNETVSPSMAICKYSMTLLRDRAPRDDAFAFHSPAEHKGIITAIDVLKDGQWAVSASGDGSCCVWDLSSSSLKHKLEADSGGDCPVVLNYLGDCMLVPVLHITVSSVSTSHLSWNELQPCLMCAASS